MNSPAKTAAFLNVVALGWGLSAALVVLFVICLAIALILPGWGASHNWIGLFSTAPLTSARVWVDGVVFSVAFGWLAAIVFGSAYNAIARASSPKNESGNLL